MTETISKNSKTEFVIAIDDEEDSDDNEDNVNENNLSDINVVNDNDMRGDEGFRNSVSQTLELVLNSIERNVNHINISSETVKQQIDAKDISFAKESPNININTTDRNPLPIDEIEDVDDIEVNICGDDSNDSADLLFDETEEDAEDYDCMILDDLTYELHPNKDHMLFNQNKSTKELESLADEIVFIEEYNNNNNSNEEDVNKEIIEISDDEEDCMIISDSLKKKTDSNNCETTSRPHKRSNSLIYSSDSFIPLSEASTSTGRRSDYNKCSSNVSSNKDWFRKSGPKSFFDSDLRSTSKRNEDFIPFINEEDPKPSSSADISTSSCSNIEDIDIIADCVKLSRSIVKNVIDLISDQCTVPFIVRYRQSHISGIDADKVRRINNVLNDLKQAKERAKEVEMSLGKQNRLNPRIQRALERCKNIFEVEHLYRLCRNESEQSEKYRNLGLSDSALSILEGKRLDPQHFVNRFAVGLDSKEAVTEGWSAIIADIISKDCDVLEFLIHRYRTHTPTLEVVIDEEKVNEMLKEKNSRNADLIQKYLRFTGFKKPIDKISAHCLMAIERGESIGLLNVYIEFAPTILNQLIEYSLSKWELAVPPFLVNCVRKAFNNQLKPSLADYIRWELRHSAHLTALDVFRNNVKYLLLEPPLRGETVIGVDPGFDSGCKIAVVSAWGVPLQYKIVKLDNRINCDIAAAELKELMVTNGCNIIALGNGSGCRKFEDLLLQKIRSGFFKPINVNYKIITESGVSWYSVTAEAKVDLPHIPPHIIGAISIARRLIDPLSELVKVDPKRLQVGMYMRDIDDEHVRKVFHEVAVECVSFCGVDVNVASFDLLSKVSGLGPEIARMIIDKRTRDGLFKSRSQLKNIDGLSWKQFEQCAGFVKIMPSTSRSPVPIRRKLSDESANKRLATSTCDYDPLDSTIIHPESYSSANTYLELIESNKNEIGRPQIRNKITNCYSRYSLAEIAELCNTHTSNMKLIIESLTNSIDFDYRINFKQIYVPEIQYFYELKNGAHLKGRVLNVTPMGGFIDCGIAGGINGWISPKDCAKHGISVNNNVLVKIVSIDKEMQRFRVVLLKVFKNNLKFL